MFIENFKKTITKYGNMIAEGVDRIDPQMAAKIRDLDISGVVNEFRILNRELKKKAIYYTSSKGYLFFRERRFNRCGRKFDIIDFLKKEG